MRQEQSPKSALHNGKPGETNFCRDCRRDVPISEIDSKRCLCRACVAERENRLALQAERVEQEQQAMIAAGKARYNSRGDFVELDN